MTKEEIAQWVIDNRYQKSENEKTSDFEMYHFLIYQIGIIESENERLKAENGILKAKIIKIRCELLASTNLCNSFEVDRIFSENKAHWNNDLGEPM